MKFALHGTSKKSALSILAEGYNPIQTNWTVSNPNVCYGVNYNNLSENYKKLAFQQTFLQGITACMLQKCEIIPAVLIINLDGKTYEEDATQTFRQDFNPIQISNVTKDDILGCYTLDKNLNHFKVFFYISVSNRSHLKCVMSEDIQEICECLDSFKFKQDSIRRKTIEIKRCDGINVPEYITI